jgi:branched-chain amino acid transport system permease protein
VTVIWAGLAVGSVYAIVALLLNLPLAQSGVFNIAQAQILVFGFFLSFTGIVMLELPVLVVVLACAVICGALGALTDVVAIRPLVKDSNHGTLVTTVGVLTVLEGVILVVWGPDARGVDFFGGTTAFTFLGGRMVPADVAVMVLAIVLTMGLFLLTTKTRWGLGGRASIEDADTAKVRGVNVPLLRIGSLTLAGALAGAVAVVLASQVSISNEVGFRLLVYGFAALVIGGVGSLWGSLLGGIIVGLVESTSALYLGGQWSALLIFALLLAVLLIKPSGLFGRPLVRVI